MTFELEFGALRREMEAAFRACLASGEHRAAIDAIPAREQGARPT